MDHSLSIQAAPWVLLRSLGELSSLFPGGLSLLWDLPVLPLSGLPHEARAAFWSALGQIPGLTLHVREETWEALLDGPVRGWFHSREIPGGAMGLAWRQGRIGWVPEVGSALSLPGFGRTEKLLDIAGTLSAGCIWGELILPLGALPEIQIDEISALLASAQARLEKDLSQRMTAEAWPVTFPFQRRSCAWRLAVLGGKEYRLSGGTWEGAAERLSDFADALQSRLRTPILLGTSEDFTAANLLGHQAMREGYPWRSRLPLPPGSPTFSPGLGADPREASPLESRAEPAAPLAKVLHHPPVALLRIPRVPGEEATTAFLRGQVCPPAIRWLPPDITLPGPHSQERPWAPLNTFPMLLDVTQATQQGLFDDLE
jgi:hypothetical protein